MKYQNYIKDLSSKFNDNFYLEIQRHGDQNEIAFEKFNLEQSLKIKIPIIATNEVYYLTPDMHEAHDALTCIGSKTYVNEKNRIKYSNQHYFKSNEEMSKLFSDLPEALENNLICHLNVILDHNFPNLYFQILVLKKEVVLMKYLKKIH